MWWIAAALAQAPGNVSTGLQMWYRADDVDTSSQNVDSWNDQSGNNNDATQNSTSRKPDLISSNSEINDEPSIRFNNDSLGFDGSPMVGTDYTVFITAGRRDASGTNFYLGGSQAANNRNLILGYQNNTTLRLSHHGNDVDASVSAVGNSGREWNIEVFQFDTSVGRTVWRNGPQVTSDSSTQDLLSWAGAELGRFNAYGLTYDGDLAEVIFYDRVLTCEERIAVEAYLSARYGLPWSSPDDTDDDGVCNSNDLCEGFDDAIDSDADGSPDGCDLCTGDDGTGDLDGDTYCADVDCDDDEATAFPSNSEICFDFIDNDCDTDVDENCVSDVDGDGVDFALDCDDNNAAMYPGNPTIVVGDGYDNDCSSLGVGDECYTDVDGDGQGASTTVDSVNPACNGIGESPTDDGDCDDSRTDVYAGAPVVVNDGFDNDCSQAGAGDECYANADLDPEASGSVVDSATPFCLGADESDTAGTDCDDTNAAMYPGNPTLVVADGFDNDCSNGEECYLDSDGDGIGGSVIADDDGDGTCDDNGEAVLGTDCDDSSPDRYPGNPEVCDGLDNDCNGSPDDGLTFTVYYPDTDNDGYGVTNQGYSVCTVETDATVGGDCDDGDDTVNPGAPEICDGLDNDCNGSADFDGGGQEVDADSDGYLRCEGDCRDTDPEIHPGAAEVCDGKDNDCSNNGVPEDNEIDDDFDSVAECDGDCDDANPFAYPGNPEICDGIDNDCSAGADNGLVFDDYWVDADGDGYGDDTAIAVNACQQPAGSVADDTDCDDDDNQINPAASEACDGIDNDCDGTPDDGIVNQDYYADVDGDGFGAGVSTGNDCMPPNPGDVANSGDCDDGDAAIHPGQPEICDNIDQDCDGDPVNGLPELEFWVDADGDGYGDLGAASVMACQAPAGTVGNNGDCDDSTAAVSPVAPEVCDGVDNDCNGLADLLDGLPSQTYYADPDGDGWGDANDAGTPACAPIPGLVTLAGDCDEADDTVNPGQTEICDDIDNDCFGGADDGLPEFDYWDDLDGDGYGTLGAPAGQDCAPPSGSADITGDCDDNDATSYPGAVEQCDQIDNNCNSLIDDNVATTDWYVDEDGDGFGGVFAQASCLQPIGTVANDLDCDDDPTDGGSINPAAVEVCDGVDNDCNGDIDEDDVDLVGIPFFPDDDEDGFGDALVPGLNACTAPLGYVDNRLDCADGNATINPNAVEACPDGVDNDCDGFIDADDPNYTNNPVTYWFDQDGDGFGTPALTVQACSGDAPLGYVPPTNGLDCDDGQVAIFPSASESCDGVDNDCNGTIDDGFPTVDYWPDLDDDGYGDDAAIPVPACDPNLLIVLGMVDVAGDCDDGNGNVNPDAVEQCDDGLDNDCDGTEDLSDTWWVDDDGDGYGAGLAQQICTSADGYATNADDCDDSDANVSPAATEVCNGIDDDCDDATPDPTTTYWADGDEDDFGDPAEPLEACEQPAGYADNDGDCDDTSANRNTDCDAGPKPNRGGCRCDAGAPMGSMAWWLLAGLGVLARRSRRAA